MIAKEFMMQPYVATGLAKLKIRGASAPSHLKSLVQLDLVKENVVYELATSANCPQLEQTPLIIRPTVFLNIGSLAESVYI